MRHGISWLVRYKVYLFLVMVLLAGGAAYYLGQSSGGGSAAETAAPVVAKESAAEKAPEPKATSGSAKEQAEQNIEAAETKAQKTIRENNERIEESTRQKEENPRYGTVKNGTRQVAPPKFKTSDVPTRKGDFHD